jgi:putative YhbY family RNA-binding protein
MTWNRELDKSLVKKLLGRSHRLKPAVVVGHAGLSDAVIEQVKRILQTHDLIKVRIELDSRDEVQAAAEEVAQKSEAALVNRIGKVAVLYRPLEEKADEEQPSPKRPAPKRPAKRRDSRR